MRVAAIDIGGTTSKACLFGLGAVFAPPMAVEWRTDRSYDKWIVKAKEWIGPHASSIEFLSISIGAGIAPDGRKVLSSNKFPEFIGRDIKSDLDLPPAVGLRLTHDCICALLEIVCSRKCEHPAGYVTFSTGIGAATSAFSANYTILSRIRIAHQIIDSSGPLCVCGKRGCAACYMDGDQMLKMRNSRLDMIDDSLFWEKYAETARHMVTNLASALRLTTVFVGGGVLDLKPEIAKMLTAQSIPVGGTYGTCAVAHVVSSKYLPLQGAARLPLVPNLLLVG